MSDNIENINRMNGQNGNAEPELTAESVSKLTGKTYWRSLNQLANTPEYREFLQREFPEGASEMKDGVTRRTFLSLMGASIAMAGLAGCRKPVERILPYVTAPENVIPGVPKHYATTMPLGNSSYGVLVESHEGRPTKIEGNELHPSTLGASNSWIQASILGLYDPDRSQNVINNMSRSDWSSFVAAWRARLEDFKQTGGEGLAVISEAFGSPTLARLAAKFRNEFPNATWVAYEPVSDENIYRGIELATGNRLQSMYDYGRADVILSLDSDFLRTESEQVTAVKGFANGRRIESEKDSMNRLYVAEGAYSLTGSVADHRLRVRTSEVPAFCAALVLELEKQGISVPGATNLSSFSNHSFDQKWLRVAASDLIDSRGRSLVVAGSRQPAEVHALVTAINDALGNTGSTISYRSLEDSEPPDSEAFAGLVGRMKDGEINDLVILGGNPIYNAPADLNFRNALDKVENSVHLSLYQDETSREVNWHIPQTHYLETWGDARAADGTLSVVQPLIAPLFAGKSIYEVAQFITTGEDLRGYDVVRETWAARFGSANFEKAWGRVLHDGLLKDSQSQPAQISVRSNGVNQAISTLSPADSDGMELVFKLSPLVHDGRFANNGWLQETPAPITKLTWDNAALMSYSTAREHNLENGDMISLSVDGRSLELPIWIVPGQVDNSIVVELGYGRSRAGRVGNGAGFDAYRLRTVEALSYATGVQITKLNRKYELASAQDHGSMEGRPLIREATLEEYRNDPNFAPEMVEHPPAKSLWEEHSYEEGYQWGMAVDLTTCVGCGACSVACQSENNIPIVGKQQVINGREMHWIRIDRYFSGDLDEPEIAHQPVTCQHCENAPCEQVCPVAATVHDSEGLNLMVYNRCIGTRYCSNNCPYKVRRFNFFNYTKDMPEIIQMAMNPDVTVRFRGVMEKCTFCIQRISSAKIDAKLENRQIRDGEVKAACQQACPADAIAFGNINDPDSKVRKIKEQNRNYTMLSELNVQTRLTYLARIRNPHPKLAKPKPVDAEHSTNG